MIILFGLGNTGKEYQNTKHNLGQIFVDQIASIQNISWTNSKSYSFAKYSQGIFLLKSTGFMNNSGVALHDFIQYYKLSADNINLFTIYDDSDIYSGRVKLVIGGNSGGHNGIKSLLSLGLQFAKDLRLKIGIRPQDNTQKSGDFVLKPFSITEKNLTHELASELVVALNAIPDNLHFEKLITNINTKYNQDLKL